MCPPRPLLACLLNGVVASLTLIWHRANPLLSMPPLITSHKSRKPLTVCLPQARPSSKQSHTDLKPYYNAVTSSPMAQGDQRGCHHYPKSWGLICAACVSGIARGEGTAPRTNSVAPQKQNRSPPATCSQPQVASEKRAELCAHRTAWGLFPSPGQGQHGV